MKIQLVSFSLEHTSSRVRNIANIINNTQSDLILFSGWTLTNDKDVEKLGELIENDNVVAILEVKDPKPYPYAIWKHALYVLKEGKITPLYTHQFFKDRKEVNAYPELVPMLIHDLKNRRTIKVANKKVMILQCGETSILRNLQSENNRAVFCLDDKKLKSDFEKLLASVDVVLNPIHSPQKGNQGKHKERRKVLSSNGRAYLSVSNVDKEDANFLAKYVHYVAIDGKEIEKEEPIQKNKQYCSWIYEI